MRVVVASVVALAGLVWAEPRFPAPARPVATIISSAYSDEKTRDGRGEAERVMDRLGIGPGSRVADLGAGDGCYTVRLARRLGPSARIYAQDVSARTLGRLAARLGAVGYREVAFGALAPADGYLAIFAPPDSLPPVESIRACAP